LTGMPEKKLKSDSSYRTLLLCDWYVTETFR
jgi:hypothetical protein